MRYVRCVAYLEPVKEGMPQCGSAVVWLRGLGGVGITGGDAAGGGPERGPLRGYPQSHRKQGDWRGAAAEPLQRLQARKVLRVHVRAALACACNSAVISMPTPTHMHV